MQIVSNAQMKKMLDGEQSAADGLYSAGCRSEGVYINARWKDGAYRVAGLSILGGHRETEFFGNLMDAVNWAKEREAMQHDHSKV